MVLEKTLESPLESKKSNQSILKEISPEYLLKGLMLKLKLPYFSHLMQRTDSLEKTLMLDKFEGRRRRGWQRMRWLDGINGFNRHEFEQAPGVYDRQGSLASCGAAVPGFAELDTTEQLNWTERCCIIPFSPHFQYCPLEVRHHSNLWYTGSLFCPLTFLS